MKITVIDYGLSNLLSVERALKYVGADAEITSDPKSVLTAKRLVLPGVGAFHDGMKGLIGKGLVGPIKEKVSDGTPLLGICLGMQMLFDESEEFGVFEGLGLISGRVVRIPSKDADGTAQTVPHIGWNGIHPGPCGFEGILSRTMDSDEMYFVHSYEAVPKDPQATAAYTIYGGRKICAVAVNSKKNVWGCQFHPEKSGEKGLLILEEFVK